VTTDDAEEVAVRCTALIVEGLRLGADEGVELGEQLPARVALGFECANEAGDFRAAAVDVGNDAPQAVKLPCGDVELASFNRDQPGRTGTGEPQ
jgi:hypothetical protein